MGKLDAAGTWQWATTAGGTNGGRGIAVDGSGNVLVTGTCDMATFGSIALANSSGAFVAKLTPAGAWQWATGMGGTGRGNKVAVDNSGNVIVSGNFDSPTATFGSTTLTNTSSAGGVNEIFVAKLTPSGAWQWATSAGGNGQEINFGLAIDGNGNEVIGGGYTGTMVRFGSIALPDVVSNLNVDAFVAKLNPAGVWQWALSFGGTDVEYVRGVAADTNGNVAITGEFDSPTVAIGPATLTNLRAGGGSGDIFVAKMTPTGTWQWATSAGGNIGERSSDIAVDGSDGLIVTGNFSSAVATFGGISLIGTGSSGSGSNNTFVARLGTTTGLPVTSPVFPFTLAPNPAHTTVALTGLATETTATLFDALGRLVRTVPLADGAATLDVRELPAGVYVVRAGTAARRLVVE